MGEGVGVGVVVVVVVVIVCRALYAFFLPWLVSCALCDVLDVLYRLLGTANVGLPVVCGL